MVAGYGICVEPYCSEIYHVCVFKKEDTKFMVVNLSELNRFSKF